MKFIILTYGCCANQNDSEILTGILTKNNYKISNLEDADIIIINTCIVKSRTVNRILYKIKQLQKLKKQLVIAGCLPSSEYKLCKELFPKAILINPSNLTNIIKAIKYKKDFLDQRKEAKLSLPITRKNNIANIQVAIGCVNACYFCEIKLAKPLFYSFPEELILKEIKKVIKQKYNRINLTATDLGCYGFDIKKNLPKLIRKIVNIKGNFKIRIGMINPEHLLGYIDDLIRCYKSDKIIKFLHIPVQSGSDKLLRDMNRNYTVREFKQIVKKFRISIPEIKISTDIIIGYPSESDKDFKKTLSLIKQIKPEVLNISKFTPRPGTKAARLKQLPSQIIQERSIELSKLIRPNL